MDTSIPADWKEGVSYDRDAKIDINSLVGIKRSDGSIKFGQVVKKAGFFYQDSWEVVVTMNPDGTPAATRVEEGPLLIRPKADALTPVIDAAPKITVNEKDISETKGDKGFFGNMFKEAVYEGGSAPSAPPAGAPPPKAAPPKAAPPKAVVPQGIVTSAPPAPPAPPPAPPAPKAAAPPAPPAPKAPPAPAAPAPPKAEGGLFGGFGGLFGGNKQAPAPAAPPAPKAPAAPPAPEAPVALSPGSRMTGSPRAKENALEANKKNWGIGTDAAPPAPKAPAPPKAAAPPAPPAEEAPVFGGLGGGLFDKLKAMVEPTDVGGSSKPPAPKQEALYEDDEMAGGMGAPPSKAPPTEIKMPFRATFDKEKK